MKIEFIQTEEHTMDFQKAHYKRIFWLKGLSIYVVGMMMITVFALIFFNAFAWKDILPFLISKCLLSNDSDRFSVVGNSKNNS